MKQEHKLVAEVYRFIAPFIDSSKPIYLSLDGQAATTAVTDGRFTDASVPDLWFSLIDSVTPIYIEAKIIDKNKVLLMQSQLKSWRTSGTGSYKPHYWIASNRSFEEFYFWSHQDFLPRLDDSKSQSKTTNLQPPVIYRKFTTVIELALHILREAKT